MKTELINKYYNLLKYMNEIRKITSNEELKSLATTSVINFVNSLYKIEKTEKNAYENLLEDFGISKDNLIVFEKDSSIKEEPKKDEIKIEGENIEFNKYTEELEKIFINPNEESIKVWLKNVILYSKDNNIDFEKTTKYIKEIFAKLDRENKYINELDNYINEINNTLVDSEKKLNENTEEELNKTKNESENNELNKISSEDDHKINSESENNDLNKTNSEDDHKINSELENNDLNKTNSEDDYKINSESENNELNKINSEDDHKINSELENNELNKNNSNEDNKTVSEQNEEKGFKIRKIKKSFNSKWKNIALAFTALAGLGIGFNIAISHPIITGALAIGGAIIFKKFGKNSKYMKEYIEKNGYNLDENDNIIDSTGKVITKEEIGKIKYNLVKNALTKVKDDKGNIDKNYKKNRLASSLVNNYNNNISNEKVSSSIKTVGETINNGDVKSEEKVDIKDIEKGMRLFK